MTTILMHVSGRLQWACNYHEICFMCLAFNFLFELSWVSWKSLLLYVCFGSGCLSLSSLCTLAVGAAQHLSSCEILVFFFSFDLIGWYVTPNDLLSCDEENRDCIMTKQHDLSSQLLSTSLNVTQYLLWKLQLKAIWPFLFSFY